MSNLLTQPARAGAAWRKLAAATFGAVAALGLGAPAHADIYDAGGATTDLNVAAGTLTINTSGATPSMTGAATASGVVDGGVAKFSFRNVNVTGGTVSVTGSRPLSIAAEGDMNWSVNIVVTPGTLGGAASAALPAQPAGPLGGLGGTGGFSGAGGAGGNGGNANGGNAPGGSNGVAGSVGNAGNNGAVGNAGVAGNSGVAGFGDAGATLGTGGTAPAGGASAGTAGVTGGSAGTAGALGGGGACRGDNQGGSVTAGTNGGTGGNGGVGQDGNVGGTGASGNVGGNSGYSATAQGYVNSLSLAAGSSGGTGSTGATGGSGGGGAGGGGAGGGGGGGGGGSHEDRDGFLDQRYNRCSGGGGGGGGARTGAAASAGNNGGGGNAANQNLSYPGWPAVGGGGGGSNPGFVVSGGTGQRGGQGGQGGAAGAGASGGGAVVLAAKGVLSFSGTVNVSAGTPGTGAAGGAGAAGTGSNAGLSGAFTQASGGGGVTRNSATSRAGGTGGSPGNGGNGGAGGLGGQGGTGGNGGRGVPGMVKLQGSVVLAAGTVTSSEGASAADQHRGQATVISNMTSAPLPTVNAAETRTGATDNDAVLTGPTTLDADTTHPKIGQLTSLSAATQGILLAGSAFWNEADMQAEQIGADPLEIVTLESGTSGGAFAGYDQIFVLNNFGSTINNVYVKVGTGNWVNIGNLAPTDIFTTTVVSGETAQVTAAPIITLTGTTPINVDCPDPYTDDGATALGYDGFGWNIDLTNDITTTGLPVVTNVGGTTIITYNVVDANNIPAVQVTRTVNVVDVLAPIITLVGADDTHECGTAYVDLGYSANDACQGDVTGLVVVGGAPTPASQPGLFVVTYDVTDAALNVATQVTRNVTVVDTTIPVITLGGAPTVTHECSTVYTDAGATAADSCDGDLTAQIVVGGDTVDNTTQPGTYTITYDVVDQENNAAVQVTRTVNVVDTTVPVITLNGNANEFHVCNTVYSDAGATVADTCDSGVTVVVGGDVVDNTTEAGVYTITYDATDAEGNDAVQVTRTVTVTDAIAPVLTLNGADPLTHECGTAFTDPGVTVTEACDQGLTATAGGDVITASTSVGSYTITYDATDASGNPATQVSRTVNVVDTVAPVITLVGAAVVNIGPLQQYVEPGANALDACEGSLSVTIGGDTVVTADDNSPDEFDTWVITYDVTDAEGNPATQVTRTVTRFPNNPPVITLNGSANVTIECSIGSYTELGATVTDVEEGTAPLVIGGDVVDVNTVGIYVVTYDATDTGPNPIPPSSATQVTRTVEVVDTTIPVITLLGNSPQFHLINTVYTDAGATASDVCEGSLTGSIVVGGDVVDVNTQGTYVITYDVQDASGNQAAQVTRTVNVAPDTTAPVITLIGGASVNVDCGDGYTELGANALDNIDGDISANVVVAGDTIAANTPPGTYTITYNVSDAAGNAATEVTRTVTVTDNCPLTVTVNNGANREVLDGDPVTFDTTVSGAIGSTDLQWFFDDGSKAVVALSGETNEDLTIAAVTAAEVGAYYLEATDDVTTIQGPLITLSIGDGLPVGGLLGICALSAAMALGGAASLRRRK